MQHAGIAMRGHEVLRATATAHRDGSRGTSILIVDGAAVDLKFMRLLLTYEGYAVRTTASAEEALQLLCDLRPELVLTDIRLPGIDGLELARRIKQDPRNGAIKVVALTNRANGEEQKALTAGCDGCIPKPIETTVLTARLRQLLYRPAPLPALPSPAPDTSAPAFTAASLDHFRRGFLHEASEHARQLLDKLASGVDSEQAGSMLDSWSQTAEAVGYPEIRKLAYASANMVRAGEVQARPLLFEITEDPRSVATADCDLTLVHASPEVARAAWFDPEALPDSATIMFAGTRAHLMELDEKVLACAAGLLADTWHPEEVLMQLHMAVTHRVALAVSAAPPAPATVPNATPALPAAAVATEAQAPATPTLPPSSPHRPNVVIADDDALILTVVGSIIENYGMKCQQAKTGAEALRAIRETLPQIAVLDINMPDMDGYEVLSTIRSESLPVTVVLLTARQREADILRGFQLGADDYLVKPFNPLELVARLKRLDRR
jgi:CheY-like chemotaxis protein